jgi:hypothetical protein
MLRNVVDRTPVRSARPELGAESGAPSRGARIPGRRTVQWPGFVMLACAACIAASGAAIAHHSIALFDREHPIELVGTVRDFKYISPHTMIMLEVRAKDAAPVTWVLEGDSPHSLSWGGWSSTSLRPNDELQVTIDPLRSGAPGGAWHPDKIRFKDGTRIVTGRRGAGG